MQILKNIASDSQTGGSNTREKLKVFPLRMLSNPVTLSERNHENKPSYDFPNNTFVLVAPQKARLLPESIA